jgi:hypothetical protein
MPITNYPSGFRHGVNILGMPVLNTYGGNVFWVNSNGGSNGNAGTRDRPFATLDYAIGRCTANNGDIIMLMPNHAETITGAGGITADVAGITIVGMGRYNQRPRFLMDGGTTVTFVVSADDVVVQNCVFASGHADVVTCFNVTAKGFTAIDLEFKDNTTDENFLVAIKCTSTTDNNADGLTVVGCRYISPDAACTNLINVAADVDDLTATDNFVCLDAATAAPMILCATGKDLRGLLVLRNYVVHGMTANDLFIDNDTAVNTGIVAHNRIGHHDVTGAHSLIDVDGVRLFDNLSVSTDLLSGVIIPAADVDL